MTLKGAVERATGLAMKSMDSIRKTATFQRKSSGSYDPVSGSVTSVVEESSEVRVVFHDYRDREVDGNIVQPGDRKVILERNQVSQRPQLVDELVVGAETWKIINVVGDEEGPIYHLHVRQA